MDYYSPETPINLLLLIAFLNLYVFREVKLLIFVVFRGKGELYMYLNLKFNKKKIHQLGLLFMQWVFFLENDKKYTFFIQNKRIFNIYISFGSKGPVPVRYTDFQKVFKTFGYHCTISLMSSMLKKSRTWMHIPTPFFAWIFFCLNLSDIEMKLKNYIEVCSERGLLFQNCNL